MSNKDELLEILNDIDPDIDYENETQLIDGKVLDSFSIITLVSQICENFDIELGPELLVPENFNTVDAMLVMIEQVQEED